MNKRPLLVPTILYLCLFVAACHNRVQHAPILSTTAPEERSGLVTVESRPTFTITPKVTPLPSPASRRPLPTPIETPLLKLIVPTVSPISKTAVSTQPPIPTATFSAYGITQTIGLSDEKRPIVSYRFGFGTDVMVIVGGIHGGYEWNTSVLAYQLIDYFHENKGEIPHNVTLYIIPSANPDGQYMVTQQEGRIDAEDVLVDPLQGRFNGNGVDLNRNWGCDWAEEGYWGERIVDSGQRPFSEPETQALNRFVLGQKADLVIFLHSAANGVFMGGCPDILPTTQLFAEAYSTAAGYPLFENFDSYPVTGDASDWLSAQGVASFAVELEAHDAVEFEQNLAGTQALIELFREK